MIFSCGTTSLKQQLEHQKEETRKLQELYHNAQNTIQHLEHKVKLLEESNNAKVIEIDHYRGIVSSIEDMFNTHRS